MSDLKLVDGGLTEAQEYGKLRLEQRVARLKRLVDLNAPPVVIANEVVLVEKAMWLYNPQAMSGAIESAQVKSARRDAGICVGQGCDNDTGDSGDSYCKECLTPETEDLDS